MHFLFSLVPNVPSVRTWRSQSCQFWVCGFDVIWPNHGARRPCPNDMHTVGATQVYSRWVGFERSSSGIDLHGLNVVANIGIEVSMLLFGLGLASLTRWEITGRTSWVLLFLSAPLGILDAYFLFQLPNLVGLPQRALLILQSPWIVAIAATLIGNVRVVDVSRPV